MFCPIVTGFLILKSLIRHMHVPFTCEDRYPMKDFATNVGAPSVGGT